MHNRTTRAEALARYREVLEELLAETNGGERERTREADVNEFGCPPIERVYSMGEDRWE